MRSSLFWRRGAAALLALVLPVASVALSAQAEEGEDDGPPPNGAVLIPYQETADIRPGEGWLIDCAKVGTIDGATITCTPETITLAAAYDPDWGEHSLTVHMVSTHTDVSISYTIGMEPPPAPEIAIERLDMPVAVGAQAMLPLAALGISCEMCTEDGGAVIEVGELPPGLSAGVSKTHFSVRSSVTGDVEIPLQVTDDAGQAVTVNLVVSFVPADDEAAGEEAVGALHTVSSASEWDLAELSWGEDVTILCTEPRPPGLSCAPDGTAKLAKDAAPAQFMFRVIGADGAQSWGSVTVDEAAESDGLAIPDWRSEAPLELVYAPSGEDDSAVEGESLLGPLTLLLEGIPGP